jgi:hypothetical protein
MKCIAASPHSRAASVQPCGTPSPCVERSEEPSRSSRRAVISRGPRTQIRPALAGTGTVPFQPHRWPALPNDARRRVLACS